MPGGGGGGGGMALHNFRRRFWTRVFEAAAANYHGRVTHRLCSIARTRSTVTHRLRRLFVGCNRIVFLRDGSA